MIVQTDHKCVAKRLEKVVVSHVKDEAGEILKSHEQATQLAMAWLEYLRRSQATGTADELLDGFHASLIETAGCLAMGLVRPAVFAMRTQVDILVAWLFFKDHPIEWEHVEATGKRYRLVSEVLKYLRTYNSRFQDRLVLLRAERGQGEEDPYHLLSAHVHSQNSATIPPLVEIHQLVQGKPRCLECVELQLEICEYLSDVLASCFATQWADLPEFVTNSIKRRLEPEKLKSLCTT